MEPHENDPPTLTPTPEGQLIRLVRNLSIPKLTIPAVAARIGLSAEQWGYIERGHYPARGGHPPRTFSPPAATLARMARSLGISPERLAAEGQRPDAAAILGEMTETGAAGPVPHVSETAGMEGIVITPGTARIIAPAGGPDPLTAKLLAGELDGWHGIIARALSDGRVIVALGA